MQRFELMKGAPMILEHLGHLPVFGGHVTSLKQGLSSLGLKTLGTRLLFLLLSRILLPFST